MPVSGDVDNIETIAKVLQLVKLGTMKFRLQQVQKYRALASELEGEEKLLHDNMHPDLQSAMRQKRILLFKRMMEDAGVVDAQLCEELTNGFRLVGQLESSGQFRPTQACRAICGRVAALSKVGKASSGRFLQACG